MFSKFFRKFRPHTPDNFVLVLDIGTEFVKALIYRIENSHGFVTGYARTRQKLGDMHAGTVADIGGVVANCEEAIKIATKMAGVIPEQTVMGIAGEFVRGGTVSVNYTREDPLARIELPELKAIIQRVQTRAFSEVRGELARETGYREVDVKFVHAAIIDSRIDGRRVVNPLGFQGREITLSIFNAFAPLIHFGALQTIASELDLDLLTISTGPYALAHALTHGEGNELSAIFVDIGGGTTDLALVCCGSELVMRMFAIGGRTFTKRLSQTFNVSFLEAERLKLDYAQNKLAPRQTAMIKKALTTDTEIWLAGVELALLELVGDKPLPTTMYLCGGGSRLPELKFALESNKWLQNLSFTRRPRVRFLVPDDISSFTDETGMLRTVQDVTPLALANLGLTLAGEESLMSTLLRKIVKLVGN